MSKAIANSPARSAGTSSKSPAATPVSKAAKIKQLKDLKRALATEYGKQAALALLIDIVTADPAPKAEDKKKPETGSMPV